MRDLLQQWKSAVIWKTTKSCFIPDPNLGRYVAEQLPEKPLLL